MPNLQVQNDLGTNAQRVTDAKGTESALSISTKDVGIGTTTPKLDNGSVKTLLELAGTRNSGVALRATDSGGTQWLLYSTAANNGDFRIFDAGRNQERVAISNEGNVGIGTTRPQEKLVVQGNILVTGDVRLEGADCAEQFEVAEADELEAGMVVVIENEERLHPCTKPYDRRVAGVISGAGDCKPGILLGAQPFSRKRLPLALSGKVFCKVDAGYAPISVGDLLTTSPSRGYAMKVTDHRDAFGAVVGKALRPLIAGQAMIPILIALQ